MELIYILILLFTGILVAFASGLLGIGGGAVLIPVMVYLLHFRIHHAAGTSAALMVFAAFGGTISYIIDGLSVTGLPSLFCWLCKPSSVGSSCSDPEP